jgi:hypothetical protein
MAYYLVTARPVSDRLDDLEGKLTDRAFVDLKCTRRLQVSALHLRGTVRTTHDETVLGVSHAAQFTEICIK